MASENGSEEGPKMKERSQTAAEFDKLFDDDQDVGDYIDWQSGCRINKPVSTTGWSDCDREDGETEASP